MVGETEGVLRLAVTFGLTFVLGFERQLRGSPAGNRTFSLIGLGAAVIGLLSESVAPNALAGAVTGIGFLGAGLVFRQTEGRTEVVRGSPPPRRSSRPPRWVPPPGKDACSSPPPRPSSCWSPWSCRTSPA